jgi:TonB family protein
MRLRRVPQVCSLLSCLSVALSVPSLAVDTTSGVTASGKRVTIPSGENLPWMKDVLKAVPPEYPYQDRQRNNVGKGKFRAIVDPKTGTVTRVEIVKSIGYQTLDDTVVNALRQWRFRAGKWKMFEMNVTFEMSRSREEAMEKLRRAKAAAQRAKKYFYSFPER